MASNSKTTQKSIFGVLFCVLTLLCWCPIGYGSYGPVSKIFGMPSWAAMLLLIGAVLFLVEWIYLFQTDLALNDEDLDEIIEELKALQHQESIKEEV